MFGKGNDACAERFCQNKHIARACTGVCYYLVLVYGARYGKAGFDFAVVDTVAADNCHPRLVHLVDAAAENFTHRLVGDLANGKSEHRNRSHRRSAHSVNVTYRISRRHLPERIRVIYRRRKHIDRMN
ncbi:hypothetical protein ES703_39714 [subsurface metagenome]